jgi:hypothetical protein
LGLVIQRMAPVGGLHAANSLYGPVVVLGVVPSRSAQECIVQHVENIVQHVENIVQHVENIVQHVENIVQHVENIVQHVEN